MLEHNEKANIVQIKARALLAVPTYSHLFSIQWQNARTQLALKKTGSQKIAALDVNNVWALRLSLHAHKPRFKHNLGADRIREKHPDGNYACQILKTLSQIIN